MSQDANYSYDVKITHGSDFIKTGPLAQSFENCGEILITSKKFKDYHECEKSLSNLMSTLSTIEAKLSSKPHVIVTKVNPILDKTAQKDSSWDRHTVIRAYIADVEALKSSKLHFNVHGQIRVDQVILGLIPAEEKKP